MTGSALVMTRLSRVAMNIGSDAASSARGRGIRLVSERSPTPGASSSVRVAVTVSPSMHRMITNLAESSYQLITCQP